MNDGTLKMGRFDGIDDLGTGSTNSSAGSPQMGNHLGGAAHHAIRMSPQMPVYDHGVGPSPLRSYSPASVNSQASTPKASASAKSGAAPLSLSVGASNDFPYHTHQQVLAERFHWNGEAHAATAILG